MIVAGIGARRTPQYICDWMRKVGAALARKGHSLHSGNATGADQAWVAGVNKVDPTLVHLFLPWEGYERKAVVSGNRVTYLEDLPATELKKCYDIVARLHPAWDNVSPAARKLLARNVLIIRESDIVLGSIEPSTEMRGGTHMGFRIAKELGIAAIDVWAPTGQQTALATLGLTEEDLVDHRRSFSPSPTGYEPPGFGAK